jgi:hypothetical protein
MIYNNSSCLCALYIGFLRNEIFSPRFYAIIIEEKYRTLTKKITKAKSDMYNTHREEQQSTLFRKYGIFKNTYRKTSELMEIVVLII